MSRCFMNKTLINTSDSINWFGTCKLSQFKVVDQYKNIKYENSVSFVISHLS